MTKEQFEERIDRLLENAIPAIKGKCLQLFSSGAEDVTAYPDNFVLPKLIFTAALQYEATQYTTCDKNEKKILRNLSHF